MNTDLTQILDDLAAGRIDAAEAGRRIDALNAGDDATATEPASPAAAEEIAAPIEEPSRPTAPGSFFSDDDADEVPPSQRRRPHSSRGVDRISVRAVGRRVRIVGDSTVTTVAAEGPHVLRRDGSTLEVTSDGELGPSLDGFSMLRPPRSLDDLRNLGLGKELYLRVNPGIIVDVEMTAGSLSTDKVAYLGKVRVTAGSATLSGVAEATDVLVQAGQATLKGSIRTGRSRLRCESGNVTVQLADDSNVTVKVDTQLGKVHWSGAGMDGTQNLDEAVMGNGSARLDVGIVMGHASVRLGERDA